jgi:uncharacterized protein
MEARVTRRIVLALLLLVPSAALAQPSFDCAKAATPVERTICGDPKLATADRELASVYGTLLGNLSGPAKDHLVKDQFRWIGNRGKTCTAFLAVCLTNRYRQRIATLKAAGEGAYPFVSEQTLLKTGKVKAISYEIDARYPQFDGSADFAAVNKAFADAAREGAKEATPPADVEDVREQTWSYEQGFELFRPGPNAVSVETTFYIFTGGAHGSTNVTAALVDLRSGRNVKPAEIFATGAPWKQTIAEIARADLKKQFVERPGFEDALEPAKFDTLMKDAERFLFKAGALELIFNQYEVGPYAAGRYTVTIPYARLTNLMRSDGLVQLAPIGSGRDGR